MNRCEFVNLDKVRDQARELQDDICALTTELVDQDERFLGFLDSPSGLTRSAKLAGLIDTLKSRYDYVLVDAPPYGIITDAAPLMTKVDGIILVARFNQTREADFDQTIENLQSIRANIIGTVMMAFDPKKASGYYYTSTYYKYAYTSYNAYVEDK